jgi:hypothetical protein
MSPVREAPRPAVGRLPRGRMLRRHPVLIPEVEYLLSENGAEPASELEDFLRGS